MAAQVGRGVSMEGGGPSHCSLAGGAGWLLLNRTWADAEGGKRIFSVVILNNCLNWGWGEVSFYNTRRKSVIKAYMSAGLISAAAGLLPYKGLGEKGISWI